jgi:hypothetical protein
MPRCVSVGPLLTASQLQPLPGSLKRSASDLSLRRADTGEVLSSRHLRASSSPITGFATFLVPFTQLSFDNPIIPAKITMPLGVCPSDSRAHRQGCVAELVACPCWPPPEPPPLRLRFLPFLHDLWFFQETRLVGISACVLGPAVLPEIPFDGDGCALRGSDFSVTGVSVVFPRSTKVPALPPPCMVEIAANFSWFAPSIEYSPARAIKVSFACG